MNNDKKMPQGNQNQPKSGNKPDMDEKQPQSDRGIGQEHGFDQKDKQSSSVKPGFDKESNAGKQPQSSRVSQSNSSNDSDLDQDDNQVTQRSNRQSSEPAKGK